MPLGLEYPTLSRSSPCIVAAHNLRQYSLDRKRISLEHTSSAPDFSHLDRIDLIGGNGRWRQKRAEEEFARRAVAEEKRLREQQEAEEKRRQRKLEVKARKRRQHEEEERRREEERERQHLEQVRFEELQKIEQEKERLRKETEEKEFRARQPKPCEVCTASGKCIGCLGSGINSTLFLAAMVNRYSSKDYYGRRPQGCDGCYGFKQNMMATLKKGTGRCPNCDGWGRIRPDIDLTSPGGRTKRNSISAAPTGFFSSVP
ncbi:Reticulocyte-binding protein 2 homolog a [Durusdinium trenchii]|uniref:Reticulocyte-binding protein 2 homolog a n=1 Tax=Durusdinium trenchii TaxID=1381693 RepID=A0ABP0PJT5_9DINO